MRSGERRAGASTAPTAARFVFPGQSRGEAAFGGDHTGRLTDLEREEIHRRVATGATHAAVADAVGCSTKSVQRLFVRTGGLVPRGPMRSPIRLSLAEREEISRGLQAGDSHRAIARRLGRAPSTIAREVSGNGGHERIFSVTGRPRAKPR